MHTFSSLLTSVMCVALLFNGAAANAQNISQDIGLNGMPRDTWLPLTAEEGAALPHDHVLNTDDCRYDQRLPRAFDRDALRTVATLPVTTVPRPGPGGPTMKSCGALTAKGITLPDRLSLGSYVLFDVDSGDILAAKDPYGLYRPASIIKILLVMVVLDELELTQRVSVTAEMTQVDGSKVGIGVGGQYSVEKLLQGLVMNSGNDAALALAGAMGGTAATVRKMQVLAESLGVSATTVTTVNGLDTPTAQTTAYDLALVYRAAFQREDVTDLLGIRQTTFPGYKDNPAFTISSDNGLLWDYPGAIGGKTGFTDNARHTYAGAAARHGCTVALVALNSTIAAGRPWMQAEGIFDAAFAAPASTSIGSLEGVENTREYAQGTGNADHQITSSTPPGSRVLPAAIGVVLGVVFLTLTGVGWLAIRRRR